MEQTMSGQENVENDERVESPVGGNNREISGELKSLEARLAMLVPRPDRLDRDRLMFLAGQASIAETMVERTTVFGRNLENRAWPAAFAAMSAIAATLLVILITRPEDIVHQPLPAATSVRQADPRIATRRWSN